MTAAWTKKKASTVGCMSKRAWWSVVSASSFRQLERVAQRVVRMMVRQGLKTLRQLRLHLHVSRGKI
jgi:predicted NAD/FAD-binding protein